VEFGWHTDKRDKTLAERGIDFARMVLGWSNPSRRVAEDVRKDYGELRFNMLARIQGRIYHITFTERGGCDLDHLGAKGQQAGATAL
jgi:uncharacterized DUF497 family protein